MATKRTAQRKKADAGDGLSPVSLRLTADLLAEVDGCVEQDNAAGRWPRMTRADWIRAAIAEKVERARKGGR